MVFAVSRVDLLDFANHIFPSLNKSLVDARFLEVHDELEGIFVSFGNDEQVWTFWTRVAVVAPYLHNPRSLGTLTVVTVINYRFIS